MNWALERDALVSIPPKATDQVSSTLSSSDINRIALIVVVLLPLAGVALGLAVYVRRRR